MYDPWNKYQFVWPKDRPKGRARSSGWLGRLGDVMTGSGSDIFAARNGEKVKADRWGNW